jgi:hypothetical protein
MGRIFQTEPFLGFEHGPNRLRQLAAWWASNRASIRLLMGLKRSPVAQVMPFFVQPFLLHAHGPPETCGLDPQYLGLHQNLC